MGVRRLAVAVVVVAVSLAVGSCSDTPTPHASRPTGPNIVFVLTDDLSSNLVQYMPQVQQLAAQGASFDNFTVTDSLCCPSRSSIFTGQFPHDTGVFTNGGNDGGFRTFHKRGNEKRTFATALHGAGYRTAMMGKYLNGYLPRGSVDGRSRYVPSGWDEWDVAGNGYPEFNYNLNENHEVRHYGSKPGDYLTDVLSGKANHFVADSAAAHKPFMLEVATFAPHGPYTPAPRDANSFPGLTAPKGPAYDRLPTGAPPWLAGHQPLNPKQQNKIDTGFRKRVQAVQAVDRMIGSLRTTLTKAGVAGDTVVVFSSDNGYHMGEYRLNPGKMTAFDTDVNVPLIAVGPGIPAGRKIAEPVQNIDLAPTFEELGGLTPASDVDGSSLVPLLRGRSAPLDWRSTNLVEHHGPDRARDDPDLPAGGSGNPTTYEALRTTTETYVEYADGTAEFYDRHSDPAELDNTAAALEPTRRHELHDALHAMQNCHGHDSCWTAAHLVH